MPLHASMGTWLMRIVDQPLFFILILTEKSYFFVRRYSFFFKAPWNGGGAVHQNSKKPSQNI